MALQRTPSGYTGTTGSVETILLFADDAQIASAFYFDAADNPVQLTVAAGGRSLPLTVSAGDHRLVVTVLSLLPDRQWTTLYQNNPMSGALVDVVVQDHKGVGSIRILGQASAAATTSPGSAQ